MVRKHFLRRYSPGTAGHSIVSGPEPSHSGRVRRPERALALSRRRDGGSCGYSAMTSRVCTVGSAAYAIRLPAARAARRASTASTVTSSPGASTGMPGG